ncbi:DUF4382 domain-containing protein [Natronomonas sp.]|uniref:DUF4382 domain-containing protein n=1 Tax=Natronomonas sp. TaxID=2184060 RepID=UPI003974E2D5
MDRRTYIEGVGAVVATGAIAGCTGGNGDTESGDNGGDTDDDGGGNGGAGTEYGVLSTSVTDQPNDIADFESLVVTIEGIWVKPKGSDGEGDEDGDESGADDGPTPTETESGGGEGTTPTPTVRGENGDDSGGENGGDGEEGGEEGGDGSEDEDGGNTGRYYIEFDEPQEADLVQLQGDDTQLVDETELEVGEYQFLQLNVAETGGVLVEGGEASVETPGNAPLQFKQAFGIRTEETTRFIADFAPFKRGNGTYLIRPVASGTQVLYGDEEADDSGTETDPEETDEEETNETDDADGGPPEDAGADEAGGDGS